MSLRAQTLILSIIALCLMTCSAWLIRLFWNEPLLVQFAELAVVNAILISLFWLAYSAYAMFWLVPKTDAIVNPELRERLQLHGDFTFFRMHRLIFYGTSSACRWCNGRLHPEFNFRRLPKELRIPLAVHFHATWIGVLLAALGAAAFKVAELWGIMNV